MVQNVQDVQTVQVVKNTLSESEIFLSSPQIELSALN